MASSCRNRVQREVRELAASKDLAQGGVTVEVVDNNLQHLKGYLRGPSDSPYEGACLQLDIRIPTNYPFVPPICKFVTRIWHPNISSQTGTICLDVLKENWAASMTLRTVLLSIQALLTVPEPKDPQDAVVASQYMKSPALFKRTARFWAQHFADAPGEKDRGFLDKVEKIREMGLTRDEVVSHLSCNDWDIDRTISAIF